MTKRISSRAVIIEKGFFYAMYRRKVNNDNSIKEYYAIPGGGLDDNETLEENVIREIKEEFSVDIIINGYLGNDETDTHINHFFSCEIINGTPKLGGEELEKCCENNYYEIKKIPIENLDTIDIFAKEMIIKAYNKDYVNSSHTLIK